MLVKGANYVDGLVQDCSNSTANALELLQSCTKPSMSTNDSTHMDLLVRESIAQFVGHFPQLFSTDYPILIEIIHLKMSAIAADLFRRELVVIHYCSAGINYR